MAVHILYLWTYVRRLLIFELFPLFYIRVLSALKKNNQVQEFCISLSDSNVVQENQDNFKFFLVKCIVVYGYLL